MTAGAEREIARFGTRFRRAASPHPHLAFLRAAENADSGLFVRGPQLQVRDYLVAGPYKDLKKYKAQDWNQIEVVVTGGVARCTCNGEVLESALKLPETGPIGLEGDRERVTPTDPQPPCQPPAGCASRSQGGRGSDALGGVVNLVTRTPHDGIAIDALARVDGRLGYEARGRVAAGGSGYGGTLVGTYRDAPAITLPEQSGTVQW